MMTNLMDPARPKAGKLALQMLLGGIVGGIAGFFGVDFLINSDASPGQAAVAGVGLTYFLMAVLIAFGLVMPKVGAKILNVEDEEELRAERRVLTGSVICMGTIGASLLLLAAAGEDSAIPPAAAFGAILLSTLVGAVITWRDWKHYDELLLQVSRDAGNFAFLGVGSVIMLWSSAAYLGLVAPISPLILVALVSGGMLLAAFVAAGRRGMLHPR